MTFVLVLEEKGLTLEVYSLVRRWLISSFIFGVSMVGACGFFECQINLLLLFNRGRFRVLRVQNTVIFNE